MKILKLLSGLKKTADPLAKQGSLRPFEVIQELERKYGIHIKSTQQLNKILAEMGFHFKEYGVWRLTHLGEKHNAFHKGVINANLWRHSVVPSIAEYLKNKK